MERLTHRRMSDGAVCANIEESKVLTDFQEFTQKVYDRLAEYEETGLTPSEIQQLKGECFGWKVDAQKYKQAETDRRLNVLLRHDGCSYCKGVFYMAGNFEGRFPANDGGTFVRQTDETTDFSFCPMCGRSLVSREETEAALAKEE